MKNLNIFGVHGKIVFLGGRSQKPPILRGELPKKERLGHFADLRRGSLARKRRVVFLRGRGLIPQCTLCDVIVGLIGIQNTIQKIVDVGTQYCTVCDLLL